MQKSGQHVQDRLKLEARSIIRQHSYWSTKKCEWAPIANHHSPYIYIYKTDLLRLPAKTGEVKADDLEGENVGIHVSTPNCVISWWKKIVHSRVEIGWTRLEYPWSSRDRLCLSQYHQTKQNVSNSIFISLRLHCAANINIIQLQFLIIYSLQI